MLFKSYLLQDAKNSYNIFLFSQLLDIFINDKNYGKHNISIGFYYDTKEDKLITDKECGIFCFFPTKETFGTCRTDSLFQKGEPILLV